MPRGGNSKMMRVDPRRLKSKKTHPEQQSDSRWVGGAGGIYSLKIRGGVMVGLLFASLVAIAYLRVIDFVGERDWEDLCVDANQRFPNAAEGPGESYPQARGYGCMVSLPGDGIMLFGGRDNLVTPLDDSWLYQSGSWSKLVLAAPSARFQMSCQVVDSGDAVLIGGTTDTVFGIGDAYVFSSASFDAITNATSIQHPGPSFKNALWPLKGPAVGVVLGFGSIDGVEVAGDVMHQVVLSGPSGTWSLLPASPTFPNAVGHATTWVDFTGGREDFWLYGGVGAIEFLAQAWKYNKLSNIWTEMYSSGDNQSPVYSPAACGGAIHPGSQSEAGAFSLGTHGYVFSGFGFGTSQDFRADLWVYDFDLAAPASVDGWYFVPIEASDDTWRPPPVYTGDLTPGGRVGANVVLDGDFMYVYGGFQIADYFADMWRFNISVANAVVELDCPLGYAVDTSDVARCLTIEEVGATCSVDFCFGDILATCTSCAVSASDNCPYGCNAAAPVCYGAEEVDAICAADFCSNSNASAVIHCDAGFVVEIITCDVECAEDPEPQCVSGVDPPWWEDWFGDPLDPINSLGYLIAYAGGGALLILFVLILIFVVICCCCCCKKKNQSRSRVRKSREVEMSSTSDIPTSDSADF